MLSIFNHPERYNSSLYLFQFGIFILLVKSVVKSFVARKSVSQEKTMHFAHALYLTKKHELNGGTFLLTKIHKILEFNHKIKNSFI